MEIAMIGLGRMGFNMTLRLLDKGHKVVAFDLNEKAVREAGKNGAIAASTIKDALKRLSKPKVVWMMIPAGKPVDETIKEMTPILSRGDILIDGGNSFFKDTIRRQKAMAKKGIHYIDVGTSGGVEGARHGACMMIGGNAKIFKKIEVLFRDMCVMDGYGYVGESGAGHFVKMVHNGIEYGMMGAIAEGFLAIEKQQKKFRTDLKQVSKVYAHGSIIESRLMSWLWDAFRKPGYLEQISCEVPKGETEEEMKLLEQMADMPVLHSARMMRVRSRKNKVCGRIISALRNMFGGHKVIKK